ncbi:MAG: hypothetical protein IJ323_05850 [Clostridia bacterium]|nr:hypothetical protein [Clostridia bacterium]
MKKLLLLLSILMAFTLVSCDKEETKGEEKKENKTENVSGVKLPDEKEEEEKKPDPLYSAVVTTSYSSWRKTYTLMDNGEMIKLAERTIYGEPVITDDGKYILYRHTEYDESVGDYVERLFLKDNLGNRTVLVTEPKRMAIDKDSNFAIVSSTDGVYYIGDFSNPEPIRVGDNVGAYDGMYASVTTGVEDKSAAFIGGEGQVTYVDPDTLEVKVIAEGGVRLIKRVAKNAVYYTTEDGLFYWNGTFARLIGSDYRINGDYDYIFTADGESFYVTKSGDLVNITGVEGSQYVLSEDEKTLVTLSSKVMRVYSLHNLGADKTAEYEGQYTDAEVYNDGLILAANAWNKQTGEKEFGYILNGEFKALAECFILMRNAEYVNGNIYYIYSDGSGKLMKYNVAALSDELIREGVTKTFTVTRDDKLYYLTDVDSNGCGNLWTDTSETLIEDNVSSIK